jgi:D-alanyl-D-alanine carboxypeptidase
VARAGSHSVGVHNFLTESWAESLNPRPLAGGTSSAVNGGPSLVSDDVSSRASSASASRARTVTANGPAPLYPTTVRSLTGVAGSAAGFGAPGAATTVPIVVNPMVSAFAESLAERGFHASDQGFIVEDMDGRVLAENNADQPFNPASVTKVATSLVAISKLGSDYRFRTNFYTDGVLDPATGILHGSLYVMGAGDPAFVTENALLIADQLNQHGIHIVEGNLVVEGQFYFNFSASREASAKAFRAALTPDPTNFQQSSAYLRFLSMKAVGNGESGESGMLFNGGASRPQSASRAASAEQGAATAKGDARPQDDASNQSGKPSEASNVQSNQGPTTAIPAGIPYLKVQGETIAQAAMNTSNLSLLAVHTSVTLMKVLKGQNDFSNNWMATVIGELVGGPDAVDRFLETSIGLKNEEVRIVTSSGLGSNFISPRAMAQILRKLTLYLEKQQIGLEQLLPVAGIDHGTLERRFTDAFRGAVVAKTGTLHSVSALAGIARTRGSGPLIFVIFNHGGAPTTFRGIQDETMKKIITLCGGPDPVRYF